MSLASKCILIITAAVCNPKAFHVSLFFPAQLSLPVTEQSVTKCWDSWSVKNYSWEVWKWPRPTGGWCATEQRINGVSDLSMSTALRLPQWELTRLIQILISSYPRWGQPLEFYPFSEKLSFFFFFPVCWKVNYLTRGTVQDSVWFKRLEALGAQLSSYRSQTGL